MREILDAIEAGATGAELESIPLPESFRAATVHKDEIDAMSLSVARYSCDGMSRVRTTNVAVRNCSSPSVSRNGNSCVCNAVTNSAICSGLLGSLNAEAAPPSQIWFIIASNCE